MIYQPMGRREERNAVIVNLILTDIERWAIIHDQNMPFLQMAIATMWELCLIAIYG